MMSETELSREVPIGWGIGAFGVSYVAMYIFATMGGGSDLASMSEITQFLLLTGLLSVSGETGSGLYSGSFEHMLSQDPGFVLLISGLIFLSVAITVYLMAKISSPNYDSNLMECAALVTAPYIAIATWLAADFRVEFTQGIFETTAKADPVLALFGGGLLVFSSAALVLELLK